MVKSIWNVKFIGVEPNIVEKNVQQVYLVFKLEENLFREDSIYEKGDQLAIHLRNVILNDLGITDLNVFNKKFCEKLNKNFQENFVILEEEHDNFKLQDISCLKQAMSKSII